MAEPIYVTKQDYYDFSGIDLAIELKGGNYDNVSDAVDIFLSRVENWCLEYLEFTYRITPTEPTYRNKETEEDVPIFNSSAFGKVVLHQIDYLRKNGDLSIQSANSLKTFAPNALMTLRNSGMANIAHKNPKGVIDPWV